MSPKLQALIALAGLIYFGPSGILTLIFLFKVFSAN
jgi:hypothetical protein